MEIVVSQKKARVPVTVFHIKGEIAADSAEKLQQQAQAAFDEGMRNLLLDLGGVSFVSSSGLRAIHNIFMMLRSASPEESREFVQKGIAAGTYKSPHLKLLDPSRSVAEVLKVAGFDMFLEIHSDLEKAVASF